MSKATACGVCEPSMYTCTPPRPSPPTPPIPVQTDPSLPNPVPPEAQSAEPCPGTYARSRAPTRTSRPLAPAYCPAPPRQARPGPLLGVANGGGT